MVISAMDLISKYSLIELIVKRNLEGYWDGPEWAEGDEVTFNLNLPAFYLDEKDMEYYEGLNYTTQDLKIYSHDYLNVESEEEDEDNEPKAIFEKFKINDEVIFDDKSFIVDSIRNRSSMSDFYIIVAVTNQESDNDD